MPDAKTVRARLQAELAKIKASGLSPDEQQSAVQSEMADAQEVLDEISAADPERAGELSGAGKIGAGFDTAFDAATLGVPALLGDAVAAGLDSDQSFADVRSARKERKASLAASNPKTAAALGIAGSVAPAFIPGVGQASLVRGLAGRAAVAAPKGILRKLSAKTAGSALAENMAQGAVAGGVGELGDGDDVSALEGGAIGAGYGAVGTGIGKAAGSLVRNLGKGGRVWRAGKLDERAVQKVKQIQRADATNYGQARGEASGMTSKDISDYLDTDQIASPVVKDIRGGAAYRGETPSDADVLMKTYKQLSQKQRSAQRTIDRADSYLPDLSEETVANLRTSKQRAVAAASRTVPSLAKAIKTHATLQGELDALTRGADIGRSAGGAKVIKGSSLPRKSPAAFQEFDVPKMTAAEQEMSLLGILGGGREALKLSGNPITAFNIIPSAVRVPLYAARNRKLVEELERRLGRGAKGKATERVVGGSLSRFLATPSSR